MGFGRTLPEGSLPVYSVDTDEDARALLTAACGTNLAGEWVARELALDQTLENLAAFSDRLDKTWKFIQERRKENRRRATHGTREEVG